MVPLRIARLAATLALLLGIPLSTDGQGLILLETAAMGGTGNVGGIAINSDQFLGARFNVTAETDISRIGGHFSSGQNGAPGPIFAAIVRIDNSAAFPKGTPFQPGEVIATTLVTTPFGGRNSEDILVPLPVRLLPGDYMLVFGSGLFGADGEATLTTVNPAVLPPMFPIYLGQADLWADRQLTAIGDPTRTMRIVVEAVPEPTTATFILFGLLALLIPCFGTRTR